MDFVRVAGAQLNLVVGDIEGNRDRVVDAMAWAEGVQADVLLLPELAITGYPPEDLLLREAFVERSRKMMVPYLVDPNANTEMFESADIVAYLDATYSA